MGYIRALISACTGLSRFPELARTPWWRVLLHYVFTLVIATTIITFVQYPEVRQTIALGRSLVAAEFGALTESGYGGFNVEKEPERSRMIHLPRNMAIQYLPVGEDAEIEVPPLPRNVSFGIIFTPVHLIMWANSGNIKMFPLAPLPNPKKTIKPISYSEDSLRTLLSAPAPEMMYAPGESPAAGVIRFLDAWWRPMVFLFWFGTLFGQTLIFLLLVSLIFGTIGVARGNRIISTQEMFALTFYPAFPAILVASLLPAFSINLPFFDFHLAFLLGSMGYMLVATNYVAARRMEAKAKYAGKGDNDE